MAEVIAFTKPAVHIWAGADAPLDAYVAIAASGGGRDGPIAGARHFADYADAFDHIDDLIEATGYPLIDHLAICLDEMFGDET